MCDSKYRSWFFYVHSSTWTMPFDSTHRWVCIWTLYRKNLDQACKQHSKTCQAMFWNWSWICSIEYLFIEMKLKNLKVQFKIEKKIHFETSRHIFLVDSATCTVYSHSKNILHITGIKSFFHLDQIKIRINKMFHLVTYKIDNQFYLKLVAIYS